MSFDATSPPPVAVIDIGSNSIKLLVAGRDENGKITTIHAHTIEARISAGISSDIPTLSKEGRQRGLIAIRELLEHAAPYSPRPLQIVATSAVRDASNGTEFCQSIKDTTGHSVRILSGTEEANLIGRGLTSDPSLADQINFHLFDLGGGSLECLAFEQRKIHQSLSLKLGCVRLTEKFIAKPESPIPSESIEAIQEHVSKTIRESEFNIAPLANLRVIGTGGTIATVRDISAQKNGLSIEDSNPVIPVTDIRDLLEQISSLELGDRQQIPGLPSNRADVLPAALATLIAVADLGGFTSYHHSFHNLRYGVASELLEA